jgi:hypothetical protein
MCCDGIWQSVSASGRSVSDGPNPKGADDQREKGAGDDARYDDASLPDPWLRLLGPRTRVRRASFASPPGTLATAPRSGGSGIWQDQTAWPCREVCVRGSVLTHNISFLGKVKQAHDGQERRIQDAGQIRAVGLSSAWQVRLSALSRLRVCPWQASRRSASPVRIRDPRSFRSCFRSALSVVKPPASAATSWS